MPQKITYRFWSPFPELESSRIRKVASTHGWEEAHNEALLIIVDAREYPQRIRSARLMPRRHPSVVALVSSFDRESYRQKCKSLFGAKVVADMPGTSEEVESLISEIEESIAQ